MSPAHPCSRGIRRWTALAVLVLGCDPTPLPVHKGMPHAHATTRSRFDKPGTSDAKRISPAALADRARRDLAPMPSAMQSESNPITPETVALGRLLYHDARLSRTNDTACATCHVLAQYGVDRARTSKGHGDRPGERNTPSVYNAGLAFVQFRDGRAPDLEAQVETMVDDAAIVRVVASIPGYREAFATAFPTETDPITPKTIARAIGAFERTLVTPGRFDDFLRGNATALSDAELYGLQLFFDAGCTQCHTGPGIGGTQFQKLGSVKPWPDLRDEGRFRETEDPKDRFVFKVPPLRNVAETGPYLHDGSIESLAEVVQRMAEHQSARGRLQPDETAAIVAFLRSLTGELPSELIAVPELPASQPETP